MNSSISRKLLRVPSTSITAYISFSSKPPNHYETLNVSQNATQDEIKTAYYKLTKQYHPDVNKSDEAKDKFRDVSAAYEIIGNYNSRRKYDRGITIREPVTRETYTYENEPENMAFYRSRMKKYKKPIEPGENKNYNFDEWTRAHYGDQLKRTLRVKVVNKELKKAKQRETATPSERRNSQLSTFAFLMLTILTVIYLEKRDNFDVVKKSKNEKIENKKIT